MHAQSTIVNTIDNNQRGYLDQVSCDSDLIMMQYTIFKDEFWAQNIIILL